MRGTYEKTTSRAGFTLAATIGVLLAVSALLVVSVSASLQRLYTARMLANRIKAQAIAEAGAGRAYAMLEDDFDLRTNAAAFPVTGYAGGTYDVTIIPVGDDVAVIQCTGVFHNVEQAVILDVKMHERRPDADPDNAYGFAILADDEISWTGCGTFAEDSRVHANSNFKQAGSGELDADISSSVEINLNGNSGEIDGDATAPEVSGKTSKVTGTITETAVPEVPFPQINLVPYYNHALANGQVYNGKQTIATAFTPLGGIMWVNGDLTISGSGDLTGCFIATGDIHCSGSGGQIKVEGYPAFLSQDGSIKFSGSGTYNGLVYTRIGDVEVVGSGTINGSIICGGDFKKAGCSTIFTYVESIPIAPNEVVSEGVLCISAWQQ